MPILPGVKLINRYLILEQIGKGGMGRVFRAKDLLAEQPTHVAVKELLIGAPEREETAVQEAYDPTAETRLSDSTLYHNSAALVLSEKQWHALSEQFFIEAKTLHNLKHPNLPRVTEYMALNNIKESYLIMELIEGQDLEAKINEEGSLGLPVDDVLGWMKQVLKALAYCHQKGVIHRDVKPANIILAQSNKVYLVDFGISQSLLRSYTGHFQATTPGYSPPEQYDLTKTIGATCDIYAAGATLYHLLTGQLPPDSRDRAEGKAQLTPAWEYNSLIPIHVVNAIVKAMDLDPDERFQSIKEFAAALERPKRARRAARSGKIAGAGRAEKAAADRPEVNEQPGSPLEPPASAAPVLARAAE